MVLSRKDRRWQELTKDSFELLELARHFELYNRTEGKSPRAIRGYREKLGRFCLRLNESLGDFTLQAVRTYIGELQAASKKV
jgi:hypothetical protein